MFTNGGARVLHIDLDAFYVAVERARDPSLRGRPVVVGGEPGGRGVVACASYEARAWGVRAGMPLAQARRLCPQAVFLPGDFQAYREASRRFLSLLTSYVPWVEPLGLDEAFMDLTGCEGLYGPAREVARTIKERVRRELGLTASVGIGPSKVVAKVASERCKPDGLLEVPPGQEKAFLFPLPVEALPGVGPKTSARLRGLGVRTVGDLARVPLTALRRLFGVYGEHLALWAQGRDTSPVLPPEAPRSISRETTFPRDTRDLGVLRGTLRALAEDVGAGLRREGMTARQVRLKLRWADFTTLTRHRTLPAPVDTDEALYRTGEGLLLEELARAPGRRVRLLGLGVGDLVPVAPQGRLLEEGRERRLVRALDALREKYGERVVQTGLTFCLGGRRP